MTLCGLVSIRVAGILCDLDSSMDAYAPMVALTKAITTQEVQLAGHVFLLSKVALLIQSFYASISRTGTSYPTGPSCSINKVIVRLEIAALGVPRCAAEYAPVHVNDNRFRLKMTRW